MLRDVVGTAPLAPDLAQDTTIVDIGWQTRMSDLVRSLSRVRATDVMQGHEPDVQLRRVRAYCHLLTRTIDLTSHWVVVRTDSEMLMERRAEAIGLQGCLNSANSVLTLRQVQTTRTRSEMLSIGQLLGPLRR